MGRRPRRAECGQYGRRHEHAPGKAKSSGLHGMDLRDRRASRGRVQAIMITPPMTSLAASRLSLLQSSLEARLPLAMTRDASRLARRIGRARVQRTTDAEWSRLASDLDRSIARRAARAANKPAVTYPADLPVAQRAGEIARALLEHPLVIVCAEPRP